MREVNIWFFFIRKHFPTGSSKVGMLSHSASQKRNFCLLLSPPMQLISLHVHIRRPAVLIHRTQLRLLEETVDFNMKSESRVCLRGTASFSGHLSSLRPADPAQRTTGGETKFPSLSVCKAASFPGQRTETGCY